MQMLLDAGIILVAYLLGAVPFGLLIVKIKTGKDIREIESGRTGGTNAMRAAGFWAGILTAVMDILKGTGAVWLASWLSPEHNWVHAAAPLFAILGHNYSIFLQKRDESGKFAGLGGGAGGATAIGGTIGLLPGSILIILPLGMLVYFTLGIASVTTMSAPIFAMIIFGVRAWQGSAEWTNVGYALGAEILLVLALRPNIKKLLEGNERINKYSLNGWLKARKEKKQEKTEN